MKPGDLVVAVSELPDWFTVDMPVLVLEVFPESWNGKAWFCGLDSAGRQWEFVQESFEVISEAG
jgi:hypothetical protein